jgi:hypothetical protein
MFRITPEQRAKWAKREAAYRAEGWGLTPASWKAEFSAGLLGGGRWSVVMNNFQHVTDCASQKDAELAAAALNYQHGSYHRPGKLGLDGID